MSAKQNIFNIKQSAAFFDVLADIYIRKYEKYPLDLAKVLFLLPNRRACQSLTEAFVRRRGLTPTILPKITPITEVDDDVLFFNGFDTNEVLLNDKKVISATERFFLFTRLILMKPADFGLKQISTAQALSLAIDLASLIDTANNQGLSFDKLDDLVPEKYASHWQETLKLLKIITEFWPQILEEREAIDVSSLKNMLISNQASFWLNNEPQTPIVVAGITASFPSIVKLLKTIKQLEFGEIYFSGIDYYADEEYWQAIDESHPQFELKALLDLLELKRSDIINLSTEFNENREKLISEIMRPATVSDKWRDLGNSSDIDSALTGIELINTKTQQDEALVIALKLRQILNNKEKTAALITYDRNLARRVCAELKRFDIEIDDTAGIPLNLSPIGIFFAQIITAAEDIESSIKFIDLLKHPFTLLHHNPSQFRQDVYNYELFLRKPLKKQESTQTNVFIDEIKAYLMPLCHILNKPKCSFSELLKTHIAVAEELACSDKESGQAILWRGDAGKSAAKLMTNLLETAETLGEIDTKDYLSLLTELMGQISIRPSYGTHPRLKILGPIEAHLVYFDYVILGEFNEGIWPKPTKADMWMSRPMKKDFGFSLPEKEIGILGADLCGFLSAPHVILTRAERVDGTPMKKSRWLLRLETVLKALNRDIQDIEAQEFYNWASSVDLPLSNKSIIPPAPCPPVEARPRQLSASAIDLLITDPYSVFAKYILHLYPLDDLNVKLDQRDYGTLIHGIIEEFNNLYPHELPLNALDILVDIGKKHFSQSSISKDTETFWWAKFIKTAEWIIAQEESYRFDVFNIINEVEGKINYELINGPFTFTAKADRIDVLKDGSLNIIDYKTGNIPSKKQVMSGHNLQLPLEGLIAKKGKFEGITHNSVNHLIYWQLGTKDLNIGANEDDILAKTEEYLLKLINTFDLETTPYHARPVPKFIPKNTDYEHLSRIREWSIQEDGENNDR